VYHENIRLEDLQLLPIFITPFLRFRTRPINLWIPRNHFPVFLDHFLELPLRSWQTFSSLSRMRRHFA
jgi:hypothetical protein